MAIAETATTRAPLAGASTPIAGTSALSSAARAASPGLHPAAWAAWLAAGSTMVFLTSNPLYIGVIGLSAAVVYATHRTPERRALDALLLFSLAISPLTIPLNLLTGSTGATVLFDAPSLTFPSWLAGVTLGGTVTGESLVYATTRAASIATIVAMVCAFNAAVDHFRLLKLAPPSLAQLGIIVTVAALLVPETLARAATLREARIVRGRSGGLRALPALLLPLLAEALERSIQRAESLDARGFGRLAVQRGRGESVVAVAGVAVATVGAFAYYYGLPAALAITCLAGGALATVAVVWRTGRQGGIVTMRAQPMTRTDAVVLATSIAAPAIFLSARVAGFGGLAYLPFPELIAPVFDPILAMAALLVLAPAVVSLASKRA
jgi:energy-coupling factor transport system permease protein